jgi:hypothetical protein
MAVRFIALYEGKTLGTCELIGMSVRPSLVDSVLESMRRELERDTDCVGPQPERRPRLHVVKKEPE